MARKRRRTRAATTTSRSGGGRSNWVVFLAGLIVGACATVLVQSNNVTERVAQLGRDLTLFSDEPAAQATAADAAPEKSEKPRFRFYTMLPEMEVEVPEAELKRAAPKPAPAPKPKSADAKRDSDSLVRDKPPPSNQYLLQVGSFSEAGDAERLKANLALLGVQARIQRVQINGADTWHRVRAGPYDSLDSVNEARRNLAANNVESMVLRVKR
jgi:cell division protein FtsN